MEAFLTLPNILNLITLTGLEIILGIDNVIFIALLVEPLSPALRTKVRLYGLSLALVLRIIMLFGASWVIGLTKPLFTILSLPIAGRNILLIIGGLFLIIKTIHEFMEMFKMDEKEQKPEISSNKLLNIIIQVIFIDLILSFDSIITAVGMSPNNITVIIVAVIISMVIMLLSSKPIGDFIYQYPSIKVIGLCFIGLIGIMLVVNGFDIELPKGYLYFAIFFSSIVETINILLSKKRKIIN
jgi:predicted tellurium resistance membrane protein TerC